MRDLPKPVKRALRELATQAHEEELRRALLPLAEAFNRWRAGHLGSGELGDLIHEFHQGPARRIFKRYDAPDLDLVIAHAIVEGLLDRTRIAPDVLEHMRRPLALFEEDRIDEVA
jgi:hypothetical protein